MHIPFTMDNRPPPDKMPVSSGCSTTYPATQLQATSASGLPCSHTASTAAAPQLTRMDRAALTLKKGSTSRMTAGSTTVQDRSKPSSRALRMV